ncbi:YdeI/OmpD-associated family protein [Lentzea sp. NPDC005914]|uniref:YdeI/OmpD-associated family protein n=1 Tax=Lentzea sp. NPDC005914 TaxID=3154572 RepID=UPI0033C73D42
MNTFLAATADDWRSWLARHCGSEKEVWLLIHHKDSPVRTIRYEEAIEHALCFGWIDSHHRKQDHDSSALRFSPRTSRSGWSALNRERAARMTTAGLMTPRGQELIDHAQATGRWEIQAPADLAAAFARNPVARGNFEAFPPSSRRLILEWVTQARRPATRERRIAETVELAALNVRAHHPATARA